MTMVEAIERLYVAFSNMPRPKHICKMEAFELSKGEEKALVNQPLRGLLPDLMRSYLFDAVYRVGTWDDFRYFLPRLLELLPEGEVEPEPVSWRLEYAAKQGFPLTEAQKVALRDFALAYWADMLPHYAPYAECYLSWGTLEPFGVTRDELLHCWRTHPAGALALAYIVVMTGEPHQEWPLDEVIPWLENAFFAELDDEIQRTISNALLILQAQSENQ